MLANSDILPAPLGAQGGTLLQRFLSKKGWNGFCHPWPQQTLNSQSTSLSFLVMSSHLMLGPMVQAGLFMAQAVPRDADVSTGQWGKVYT